MALPPTIPTSFVPRAVAARPERLDFTGALFFVGVGALALMVLAAGAVFAYKTYLASEKANLDAVVAHDEQTIDPASIEGFVRLQQRIDTGSSLINSHISVSNLFDLLEKLTPQNVRFGSMTFVASDNGNAYALSATGSAKSFNALAVASASFSATPWLHNIIFANLSLDKTGQVSFTLNADIDPKLVTPPPSAAAVVPSTPATTTPPVSASTTPTSASTMP